MKTYHFSATSFNNKDSKSEYTTTTDFYTVSAVLQIYEYEHTEFFSLSLREIKEKYNSWARTGHEVLRSSVRLGNDFVRFNGYSDLLELVSQYENAHVMVRTR